MEVPVVDLTLPEAEAAALVRAACESVGFFYVSHHAVDEALVAQHFGESRRFFSLPYEKKLEVLADKNNRGYTPMGEETLDPARQVRGDTKEGYYIGREKLIPGEEGKPLHGPNQWPAGLPGWRETMEEYFEAMHTLGMRLLRLIALALGLEPEFFDSRFSSPMLFLRPLHYAAEASRPEQAEFRVDGVFAAGAHSDYGMLTILKTDEVPGLQILLGGGGGGGGGEEGGAWVDVPPVEGAFIVNLGDMLERWSNGTFRSTVHRVVSAGGRERFSTAFFFEPNFDTVVECLSQCCSSERPARYPPTTSGQHLLDKYSQTHEGYKGPTSS